MKKSLLIILLCSILFFGACVNKDKTIVNEITTENLITNNNSKSALENQQSLLWENTLVSLLGISEPEITTIKNISANDLAKALNIPEQYSNEGCLFTKGTVSIFNFKELGFSLLNPSVQKDHPFVNDYFIDLSLLGENEEKYLSALQVHKLSKPTFVEELNALFSGKDTMCFEEISQSYINANYYETGDLYWIYKNIDGEFISSTTTFESQYVPMSEREYKPFTGEIYARYSNFGSNSNQKALQILRIGNNKIDEDTGERYCYNEKRNKILTFFWTEQTPDLYYSFSGYDLDYFTSDGIACPARAFDINNPDGTSSFLTNLGR